MSQGVHEITEDSEKEIGDYIGDSHSIALNRMDNELFLMSYYEKKLKNLITLRNYK